MECKARLRGLTHAVGRKPSASQDEARLRGLAHAVGRKPSARQGEARLRGLTHAVGLKPSASQDEARLRGLAHAVGRKPSARQDEARLRGLERIVSSKTSRSPLVDRNSFRSPQSVQPCPLGSTSVRTAITPSRRHSHFPISAPPRRCVSRSDARGDAEHAEPEPDRAG
jgi:hypothetical protein